MKDFDYWYFAAGLALFVFGMMRIEGSLKDLAGRSFKKFLQRQTRQPLRAVLAGTAVTAVLQSSSVVLLMVLSFVGAGIMEMRNALALVLGSNLGTTISSWIVAIFGFKFEIEKLSYPILALALAGFIFFRSRAQIRQFSEFLVGFALLFIGLSWMKESASALADPNLLAAVTSRTPYIFIPIGFLFTVIIQSSSATMAITLTALHSGLIPLEHAAAMVIGAELGTSIKIMVGAIGGIPDKKRVALGNLYFNSATLILAALILYPLLNLIGYFLPETEALIKLVLFQSSINLLSIFIFLPFLRKFADLLEKYFSKGKGTDLTLFIHKISRNENKDVIKLAEMEIASFFRHAFLLNRIGLEIAIDNKPEEAWYKSLRSLTHAPLSYNDQYQNIKLLQGEILEFLQEVQQEKIEPEKVTRLNTLTIVCREVIHGVKNIKDIRHNLKDLADTAEDELYELFKSLQKRENFFYEALEKFLDTGKVSAEERNQPEELIKLNKEEHELEISKLLSILREDRISEIEVSTMLNVYREIYSSHKVFLLALSDFFKLSDKE